MHKVSDPYRDFEQTQSKKTLKWIDAQYKIFSKFLGRNKDFNKKYREAASVYKMSRESWSIDVPEMHHDGYYYISLGEDVRKFKKPGDFKLDLKNVDESTVLLASKEWLAPHGIKGDTDDE